MSYDLRKKGCPNENCGKHQKHHKYKAEDNYCTECGSELVYVCARCFKQIPDEGPDIRYCEECEAKIEEPTLLQRGKYVVKGFDLARKDAVKNAREYLGERDIIDNIIESGSKAVITVGTFAYKRAEKIVKRIKKEDDK